MTTGCVVTTVLSLHGRDSAVPVYRTDGVFLGYVGSCTDVTARVEAEEALRSSQERLQLMLRGSQDAAWDWDLATKTAYCSPQWWGMLGRQPSRDMSLCAPKAPGSSNDFCAGRSKYRMPC